MSDRTLIKGGIVLTQDDGLGELPNADILVEDGRIAAVGPNLSVDDARVIDAEGDIVIPGFIDTHRHTWETSIRTCAPDYPLIAYFGNILDKFAPHYRPDDVYAATLWGALEGINAGITGLVDWAHIINTPDHADAGDQGTPGVGHPVGLSPTASATRRSWTGGSGRITRVASSRSMVQTRGGSDSSTSTRTRAS